MTQRRDPALLTVAAFAFCLVLARAYVQSATIDECDSYVQFAALNWASHWAPHANNHVLNSAIMRLFTSIFGVSHLTLRSSALIGAAMFILAVGRLAGMLAPGPVMRVAIFAAMALNPLILDFLVAARGYSMALGFLATAVWLLASEREEPKARRIAAASLSLGLAFSANFAFAWVCAGVGLGFLIVSRAWRLTPAYVLPGTAAALVTSGSTFLTFPRSQLFYGSKTLAEMWRSIARPSLQDLNPQVVNPLIFPWMNRLIKVLPLAFGVSVLLLGVLLFLQPPEEPRRRKMGVALAIALGFSFGVTLISHFAVGLPLPANRTGIFFVALTTLLLGVLATAKNHTPLTRGAAWLGRATLIAGAVCFIGCLRLSYFDEWKYQADNKQAFEAVRGVVAQSGIHELVAGWEYAGAMEFYRDYWNNTPAVRIIGLKDQTSGPRRIYVLHPDLHDDFVARHKCDIVYKGDLSGILVEVCPAAAT